MHALDRVMMAEQYVIPSYAGLTDRIAYWNRFGHPDFKKLKFDLGFPTTWWWDADKAAKTGGAPVRRPPRGLTRRGVLAAGGAALAAPLLHAVRLGRRQDRACTACRSSAS